MFIFYTRISRINRWTNVTVFLRVSRRVSVAKRNNAYMGNGNLTQGVLRKRIAITLSDTRKRLNGAFGPREAF